MPSPLGLPPLPPPRLQLPEPRRHRLGVWISLIAHLVVLLSVVELTRDATFWKPSDPEGSGGRRAEGGGGGSRVQLIQLPSPPAPPPAPLPRVAPPVRMPTTIPAPEITAPPQPVDTMPRPAPSAEPGGAGGGSGGGSGGGAGPGSGPGSGPGNAGGGGGAPADSGRGGARPPEPRQLILPPFDYPRSMRGQSIDVTFHVLADGRVDHVVFVPEIPDRSYAKKLEDAMRAYRFRPARSADGQAVPGIAIVKVSF